MTMAPQILAKAGDAAIPRRERRAALTLALPALIVLVFLYALPLARLLSLSFRGDAGFSLEAYGRILGDAYGRSLVWNSLRLGLITTAITLVVGYPAAFGLAMSKGALRSLFLASLFLPLAASVIAKAFAWTILLRSHGAVNDALLLLHITDKPIRMIFTQTSLIVACADAHSSSARQAGLSSPSSRLFPLPRVWKASFLHGMDKLSHTLVTRCVTPRREGGASRISVILLEAAGNARIAKVASR